MLKYPKIQRLKTITTWKKQDYKRQKQAKKKIDKSRNNIKTYKFKKKLEQ